jgi:hypothetical protein
MVSQKQVKLSVASRPSKSGFPFVLREPCFRPDKRTDKDELLVGLEQLRADCGPREGTEALLFILFLINGIKASE